MARQNPYMNVTGDVLQAIDLAHQPNYRIDSLHDDLLKDGADRINISWVFLFVLFGYVWFRLREQHDMRQYRERDAFGYRGQADVEDAAADLQSMGGTLRYRVETKPSSGAVR
jgi:hypothetical protein